MMSDFKFNISNLYFKNNTAADLGLNNEIVNSKLFKTWSIFKIFICIHALIEISAGSSLF